MAARLRFTILIALLPLLAGCKAPWSSSSPTPTAIETSVGSVATSTPTITGALSTTTDLPTQSALPTSDPSAVPTSTPSPNPSPTPTPSPTPQPTIQATTIAQCCGVFAWLDADRLLVFDIPSGKQQGSYLVNVRDDSRTFVSDVFGTPSASGLVAFPNAQTGATEIRRADGSLVSTLQNGGSETWISPDGQHVVWLVDQGIGNTSSLVKRIVKLVSANVDGSNQKSVLEFEDTSLQWLPDNVHVLSIARAQDGTHPGIWSVDTRDGTNGIVVPGTYIQALRVSPDGQKMAYLVTFSGDASKDGVWVSDVDGSNATHLSEIGGYRWSSDSTKLWFLRLAPPGGGNDQLDEVDIATDTVMATVPLDGRVLGGEWEVSAGGDAVAFWNESDETVHVQALTP